MRKIGALKIVMGSALMMLIATAVFAADIDRHSNYVDGKAEAGKTAETHCKGFYGKDDNRSPCNDFCSDWRAAHDGATCTCEDSKCPADEK